jgi:hypothetical protein
MASGRRIAIKSRMKVKEKMLVRGSRIDSNIGVGMSCEIASRTSSAAFD